MNDRDYLEWELRQYERRKKTRNERKRSRYEWGLILSIIVWAVFIVSLLASSAFSNADECKDIPQEENAPETLKTAIIEVEPELDLTKFPSIENATLTHYCICKKCCGKDESHPAYGITASGRVAEPYVSVAVDPALIPLGSTVYIDYGDGEIHEYRADDTGSAITGAKIDLCVTEHNEALELGVKTARVWWDE